MTRGRAVTVTLSLLGVGGAACGPAAARDPWAPRPGPASASWRLPEGWRTEVIPFPLAFAPTLALAGVEELRFPPGFLEPGAPGFWSYAFAWRLDRPARLSAPGLAEALVTYFRGLTVAVDEAERIADTAAITATARTLPAGDLALDVTTYDAFKTGALVHLTGRARRVDCGGNRELWVVGLVAASAPASVRADIAALAGEAACGQTPVSE